MKPLVYEHGVAATVYEVTLIAWAAAELYVLRRNRGRARPASDPTYFMMGAALTIAFTAGATIARYVRATDISAGGRTWPVIAGMVLLVAGIALRFWAIVTLGRYFTYAVGVQSDHQVVQSGPYRVLRHPSYTGLLLSLVGVGIALDNWLALAVLVLLPLAAILVRIRREERTLTSALGDAYASYSEHTWRLVPGLW